MKLFTLLILSCSLAMDSFSVSISMGFSENNIKLKHALLPSFFFAFFQAFMPFIGYLLGKGFYSIVSPLGHIIAFILLFIIGVKMIYEALHQSNGEQNSYNLLEVKTVLFLAIATSIDAFAAGISFSFLNINLFSALTVIGTVTFILSFIGIYIGKYIGTLFGRRLEIKQ